MDQQPKGICRLAAVAMRTKPTHDAKMSSQVLFGEHYTILQQQGDWLEIKLEYDDSQGWISRFQHSEISQGYFDQINHSDYKVCMDLSGTIFFQKKKVHIVLGSILPIATNELFKLEEQLAFNGESKSLSQRRDADFLIEVLKKFDHAPELPGGKTPFGLDAAAFVQQAFKLCGYRLPRYLDTIKKSGKALKPGQEPKAGDILIADSIGAAFISMGNDQWMGMSGGCVQKKSGKPAGEAYEIRRVMVGNMKEA